MSYMLEALSGSVQASALDLSQNGIATLEFQDRHRRLYHVTTLLVGRLGDLWEWTVLNHQHFSAGFLGFFAFAFKTLIFLCWPFLLLVLNFCVFWFCFSCCCCCWTNQVAMFWFLFLLFWVSLFFLWYVFFFCLFLVCFVFFMEGLGVR